MSAPWICNRCGHRNVASNEECFECDTEFGWEYDGPEETPTDNGPQEEAHRMEQARRLK